MIELKFHNFLKWSDVENLIEKSKNTMVVVKLPESIYNSPKMKYKIEKLEKNHIIVEIDNEKPGRSKSIPDKLKEEAIKLYLEGYTLNQIANKLKLPKSTLFINIKENINEIKINRSKEEINILIYKYKEYLINNDLYGIYIETQFSELKIYVDNNNIEEAYVKLKEILTYVKEKKKELNKKKGKN